MDNKSNFAQLFTKLWNISVMKQSETHEQSLLLNDKIALISMNSCDKPCPIINKTVFQLGSVALQHCISYMIIDWHISLLHFLLILHQISV